MDFSPYLNKPQNRKSRKPKRTIKESEQERRRKTQQKRSINQKDRVFEIVQDCLCECSEKIFLTRLKSQGLKLYRRDKEFWCVERPEWAQISI